MCTDYKIRIGDFSGWGYAIQVLTPHYISHMEVDYKDWDIYNIKNIFYIDDVLNSKQLNIYISRYLC